MLSSFIFCYKRTQCTLKYIEVIFTGIEPRLGDHYKVCHRYYFHVTRQLEDSECSFIYKNNE